MRIAAYFRRFGLLTEHYAARQLSSLSAAGCDVRVYCVEDCGELPGLPYPVFALHRRRSIRSRAHLSLAARWAMRTRRDGYLDPGSEFVLRTAIARFAPDLVYSMYGNYCADLGGIVRLHAPIVIHLAGSDIAGARKKPHHYQRSLRAVGDASARILCGSNFLREKAIDFGFPASKVAVHYLGVEAGGRGEPHRDPVVLAVSRLVKVKGVDDSVRVFAAAVRATGDTETRLVVCGDGPERNVVQRAIAECGVEDRVELRGAVPNAVVRSLLTRARAFLQMNRTTAAGQAEGLGGTLLEAAAADAPIVATDSGGTREAVAPDGALLVAEGDVHAGAEALASILRSPALGAGLAQKNHEYFLKNHCAAVQDKVLGTIFTSVLQSHVNGQRHAEVQL